MLYDRMHVMLYTYATHMLHITYTYAYAYAYAYAYPYTYTRYKRSALYSLRGSWRWPRRRRVWRGAAARTQAGEVGRP